MKLILSVLDHLKEWKISYIIQATGEKSNDGFERFLTSLSIETFFYTFLGIAAFSMLYTKMMSSFIKKVPQRNVVVGR